MKIKEDIYENYYWQNDKIRLRLWEPKDYEESYKNDLDSECMALVQEEICLPPKKVKIALEENSAEPNTEAPSFTIVDLEDNYVGHIHFNYINERHGTFSLGLIISKEHRGKGYGKSAMLLMLKYAFNERRLHKFEGFCYDDNVVSAKMMESLGCKREGISRECVYMNGKYHDRFLYGLTVDEYRELQTK
jgi:RimJ/RimL family protein N-acetyltransferase